MAKKIKDKVKSYLAQDPLNRGEPLAYKYQGLYRYRFSDYRVIYEVKEKELLIFVVKGLIEKKFISMNNTQKIKSIVAKIDISKINNYQQE